LYVLLPTLRSYHLRALATIYGFSPSSFTNVYNYPSYSPFDRFLPTAWSLKEMEDKLEAR
jgi:hypothetical protein